MNSSLYDDKPYFTTYIGPHFQVALKSGLLVHVQGDETETHSVDCRLVWQFFITTGKERTLTAQFKDDDIAGVVWPVVVPKSDQELLRRLADGMDNPIIVGEK